tara:strand:- start:96 stop:458 length:363 start_codon:yes stop_codon:yes gene_type:complete
MRRTKAFSTVDWRKYLDVKTNPRAKNFLKAQGDDVLWQISQNIQRMIRKDLPELVLLVHPNAGGVIKITKSEYKEVLELCLNWFEAKENYSRCLEIQQTLSKLLNHINKQVTKKVKETII